MKIESKTDSIISKKIEIDIYYYKNNKIRNESKERSNRNSI